MKLIEQSHEILRLPENLKMIERVARTCYQSQDKIKEGSDIKLVDMLLNRGHFAMIEFEEVIVRFITNRGVTHELVRHRLCSFAQESTRYVKYDGEMEFIKPVWWSTSTEKQQNTFINNLVTSEFDYQYLLASGWQPQQAREVLPNALKTEINVKANVREWRHIFKLRCSKKAHPQIRALMLALLVDLRNKIPLVFDDIEGKEGEDIK